MFVPAIAATTRLYPFASGCGRLANKPILRRLVSDLPVTAVPLRGRLPGRPRLFVDPSDYVGRTVFLFGDLDPKVTWFCRRHLRLGDNVLDVGANHGLISILAAELVGKSGQVHAFEPQPRMAELVRRSASLNGYDNVTVHELGLGAQDDNLSLFIPKDNGGAASFLRQHEDAGDYVTVPVRRSGPLWHDIGLPIRLLKLDVEGFESDVLRGAESYLSATPPDAVLLEANDPSGDNSAADLLRDLGYRLFGLPQVLVRPRLVPLANIDGAVHDVVAMWPMAG